MSDYTRRSLNGIWVGDCIGNIGQLYFVHDILKALEQGLFKFGPQLDKFHKQFQYSDDTEEAIVLYLHLKTNGKIYQDELAKEYATRYYTRDPDGEIYGYGLNTRKVLKDIYHGIHWSTANKIIKKAEGMPSHIDSLVDSLATGRGFKDAMVDVNKKLQEQKAAIQNKRLEGSCGNGSAMRVAVLGAYLAENDKMPDTNIIGEEFSRKDKILITEAVLQAEVTHCHPEGIAGSIAITKLANLIATGEITGLKLTAQEYYQELLRIVPPGQVRDGIERASKLPLDLPVGKVIEVLGNGQHVTCQDTVPFCCYEVIKHLFVSDRKDRYEKAIIETSMAFGDVDTNCAIVGGCIAISADVPEKWINFCQPMEDVIEGIPEVELILPNQENSL
jgi:ADP-ribosylglycohydrolase